MAVGATGNGRELVTEGAHAYVLKDLGGRHSDEAIEFLIEHAEKSPQKPFFLYYPSNSNHGPYTPDSDIAGVPVAGAARTKSGKPMDARHDYIYENDVALRRFLDYLEKTDDPRNPDAKLIENTMVIFTSDNGAEKNSDIATGPFRSHKGSVFEGGHRVPFLAAWKSGMVKPGSTNHSPIGLIDLYATFSEILGEPLPDLGGGEKGAEDSKSILAELKGSSSTRQSLLFFNDHKEAKDDPAVAGVRLDNPEIDGKTYQGKWKLFFDASLIRKGTAKPLALYELSSDQMEEKNRISETNLEPLVGYMSTAAQNARNSGGIRYLDFTPSKRITYRWGTKSDLPNDDDLKLNIRGADGEKFHINERGLGLEGGKFRQVDEGEALLISFDRDVLVESVGIIAGNGICGGFYRIGEGAPLAIYCLDADIDEKDQSGLLSDMGVLKRGEILRLDSSPHFGVESPGSWRLQSLTVRGL